MYIFTLLCIAIAKNTEGTLYLYSRIILVTQFNNISFTQVICVPLLPSTVEITFPDHVGIQSET